LGVPLIVTVHTGPFSKLLSRRATRHLARRTLERADCVCPVSHDLSRQIAASGIRPRRVEVTYNPVDTDLFRPRESNPRRAKRIAFAGRLEEYKGGLRSVRAFAKIAQRWPEWSLVVAGDGPELPAIERLVQSSPGLSRRVEVLGLQTKAQLARLFSDSGFLVYPSRHETFGLVLAEAMSAGLPVIGPDRTAPPEFVDERSGILVPPDDVDAIAAALERMLRSLETFDRGEIRESVVRRFGLEAFGQRLVDLYEDLLATSPKVSRCAA
jgi:glycosyltransferase involved in cell wall biosynthesis